jgi:rubrerythrin
MPALKSLFRHVFSSETVLYECRNCGTCLDEDGEQCPECSATDIATYQLTS